MKKCELITKAIYSFKKITVKEIFFTVKRNKDNSEEVTLKYKKLTSKEQISFFAKPEKKLISTNI